MRRGAITRVGVILAVAAMAAACGDGTGGETTTTVSTPVTTTMPTTTTTAPPRPVVLSDLTGRWESEENAIQFDEGGSYELFELDPDDTNTATGVIGFVALQEGQLIFATSANPNPCPGETGVYLGELREETLHLSVVDEPCVFREEAFALPFTMAQAG